MDTTEFLRLILPSKGLYIAATPAPVKDPGSKPTGFINHVRHTLADMVELIDQVNENSGTIYHACASYEHEFLEREKDGKKYKVYRVQENVKYVRSLWLDLDIGADSPTKFPDIPAAVAGLKRLLDETGLPRPLVVSSGYGLHIYWPFTEDVPAGQWKTAAGLLKQLTSALEVHADPARTSDSASILRPVGSFNRKNPKDPKPVCKVGPALAVPHAFADLYDILERACVKCGIEPAKATAYQARAAAAVNAEYAVQTAFPDSHAERIATKCNQIRLMRDTRGCIPEPAWYACIQVLNHTVEAPDIIHAWSNGYDGYSEEETNRKIEQAAQYGPTTCERFREVNPSGCVACPYMKDKKTAITSPIQTGTYVEALPAPVVVVESEYDEAGEVVPITVDIPNPPAPFKRTAKGLYITVDGVDQRFHDSDLYPIEVTKDDATGESVVEFVYTPKVNPQFRFRIPVGDIYDTRALKKALGNQTAVFSGVHGETMVKFIGEYVKELIDTAPTRRKYRTMGWQDDGSFVLGKKLLMPDGRTLQVSMAQEIQEAAGGLQSIGNIEPWLHATELLGRPGMESHALAFLSGVGAPFLRFLGHKGATISLMGPTGTGKTLTGRLILAAYGRPDGLMGSYSDTPKARIERMGVMRSLPVYIDELTNIPQAELSNLIYRISEGRSPTRLNRAANMRPSNTWATFLIVSTNQSLITKLQSGNGDSQPEQMRVFEYLVTSPGDEMLKELYARLEPVFLGNYGIAGERLIQWAASQPEHKIRADLKAVTDAIAARAGITGQERFWAAVAGVAYYTGMVMQMLGLIRFDARTLLPWLADHVKKMRGEVTEHVMNPMEILGSFLDETLYGRLVVTHGTSGAFTNLGIVHEPRGGQITARVELHTNLVYVARAPLVKWLAEHRFDYNAVRTGLTAKGVLLDSDARKTLGGGTTTFRGTQVPCWKLDLNHPMFSDIKEAPRASTTVA